jgi:ferredoxin-type protein NapG
VAAQQEADRGAERRRFLASMAGSACSAALVTTGVALYAAQARARAPSAVRPPGALEEARFAGACVRCGLCVRNCPYGALKLGRLGDPVPTGTPYFEPRKTACEMCPDIPCVPPCPSGALDHTLTDIDQARMGLAVLADQENCLNFLGLRCDVCYRVCPLIGKAISLEPRHNERSGRHTMFIPTVHSERCTGCGKCENACVLEQAAIKVLPLALAKARLGGHYRLGWEEKRKAGGALVPGELRLPPRVPEVEP